MAPPAPRVAVGQAKKSPALDGAYTWQEIAKHNTAESAWVIVRGRVYDVTGFLDKHPGGREMLLLSAGRECTDLFAMYHALSDKPERFLAAYDIGAAVGAPEFTPFAPDTGFWDDVRGRVKGYFKQTGLDPKGGVVGGTLRMIPVLALLVASFLVMNRQLLPDAPFYARVMAAVVFGVCQVGAEGALLRVICRDSRECACFPAVVYECSLHPRLLPPNRCQVLPLLHVMHDASHTSIGRSEASWRFFGRLTMDWICGASMLSWHHQVRGGRGWKGEGLSGAKCRQSREPPLPPSFCACSMSSATTSTRTYSSRVRQCYCRDARVRAYPPMLAYPASPPSPRPRPAPRQVWRRAAPCPSAGLGRRVQVAAHLHALLHLRISPPLGCRSGPPCTSGSTSTCRGCSTACWRSRRVGWLQGVEHCCPTPLSPPLPSPTTPGPRG